MEQVLHKEVITSGEIERILEAFRGAIECAPRGVCLPDEAHIVASKYYVAFVAYNGEVRLVRNGASPYVEVKANDYSLIINSWGMFTLKRGNRLVAYGPRIAVGKEVYDVDEFVEFVRKGMRILLNVANWV